MPETKTTTKIAYKARMRRLDELIQRGVTNLQQLADAFGVAPQTIVKNVKTLHLQWGERNLVISENAKNLRTKQYEAIYRAMWNEWESSGQEIEEITVKRTPCQYCHGKGYEPVGDDDDRITCTRCDGGYVCETTTKITQKLRDPKYLALARDVIKECGRLEGLEPAAGAGRLVSKTKLQAAMGDRSVSVEQEVLMLDDDNPYENVPNELLIQGLAAIAKLDEHVLRARTNAETNQQVIEAKARRIEHREGA